MDPLISNVVVFPKCPKCLNDIPKGVRGLKTYTEFPCPHCGHTIGLDLQNVSDDVRELMARGDDDSRSS